MRGRLPGCVKQQFGGWWRRCLIKVQGNQASFQESGSIQRPGKQWWTPESLLGVTAARVHFQRCLLSLVAVMSSRVQMPAVYPIRKCQGWVLISFRVIILSQENGERFQRSPVRPSALPTTTKPELSSWVMLQGVKEKVALSDTVVHKKMHTGVSVLNSWCWWIFSAEK